MANEYSTGMLHANFISNITNDVTPKINTGICIIDALLSFLVMSLISCLVNMMTDQLNLKRYMYFFDDIQTLINKISKKLNISKFCKKDVKIVFSAKNSGIFYEYSDSYLSILHYINTSPEVSSQISSKEEIKKKPQYFNRYFNDDDDEDDNNSSKNLYSKKDIIYRITQFDNIKLEENVYCYFVDKNEEKSQKTHKGDYQTVNVECLNIVLFTKTEDINYLQKFVDKIYSDYIKFKNDKAFKGKMYFSYEGLTDKKRPIWKEFPWHTNKTYKNIFIENKEKILGNINKLKNMKKFNKRIGRPNQMNILIWGNDFGCGKTSLLKAICNVEFPERHIININLAKIKTCKELEDIFINTVINGRKLNINQCIFIIDEIEKCCPVLLKENNIDSNKKDYTKLLKKYSSKLKIEEDDDDEFIDFCNSMKKSSCENYINDDRLNLGFILSLLDGPIEFPERIMIFTANDKNKLHPALIRPGRIDVDIHLKKATKKQIIEIISFIFEYDLIKDSKLISKIDENIKDYDICPSAIYEACLINNNFEDKFEDINNTIEFIIEKINN